MQYDLLSWQQLGFLLHIQLGQFWWRLFANEGREHTVTRIRMDRRQTDLLKLLLWKDSLSRLTTALLSLYRLCWTLKHTLLCSKWSNWFSEWSACPKAGLSVNWMAIVSCVWIGLTVFLVSNLYIDACSLAYEIRNLQLLCAAFHSSVRCTSQWIFCNFQ